MFLRLLAIEARKTFKHPALWIGLGGLVFLLSLITLIEHVQIVNGHQPASGGLERDLLTGLSYFSWIGTLVYAVTASVIMAFDYPDRSIQLWLIRGVPRSMLLFSRLIAILSFGLMIVCFATFAMLGLASISRLLFFGSVDASNMNWAALPPMILRVFWSALPYLALTVLAAVLSRSPLFAAGGTIIYETVIENLLENLTNRFPTLIRYLPSSLSQVLQIKNFALDLSAPALPPDAAIMPEARAVLAVGIIFIILSAISLAIFSRQDLGG